MQGRPSVAVLRAQASLPASFFRGTMQAGCLRPRGRPRRAVSIGSMEARMSENPLIELQKLGQSIWYDNIRRALITSGDLQQKIGGLPKGVTSNLGQKVTGDDLRGVTSNPAIFEKAIVGSTDYDEAMRKLIAEGKGIKDIYESLVIEDIQNTADLFAPVY